MSAQEHDIPPWFLWWMLPLALIGFCLLWTYLFMHFSCPWWDYSVPGFACDRCTGTCSVMHVIGEP